MISARNVLYPGKPLLNCNIETGMDYEQVTQVLAAAIELLHNNQSLDGLDLNAFGIECPPEDKGKLLNHLFDLLLKEQQALSLKVAQINNFYQTVQQSVGQIKDEKVKVSSSSTVGRFLEEAITGTPGRVKVVSDKVQITGLIPVGTRAFVNPNRVNDFDVTGKGKVGTDLEGWYIRNGQNGTDNALGRFPRYTDTLSSAGQKGGSNQIDKILMKNLEAFTLSVDGSISESLITPVKIKMKLGSKNKCFGISSCLSILIPDQNSAPGLYESEALNLKHSHSHTLSVKHTNNAPEPISIIPEHIKEIPIEFKG